ncbi:MAG: hypothetical protein IPH12_14160 [Saprospirales bacterium]|nr:hypothetical protein [Saprospirales bacterium]
MAFDLPPSAGRTVNLYKMKDSGRGAGKSRYPTPEPLQTLDPVFSGLGRQAGLAHDLMRHIFDFCVAWVLRHWSWMVPVGRLRGKVHYLVLSVLVGSVAVPIYCSVGKIGASNQEERKAMFEAALGLFDLKGMTLLADREYIGKIGLSSKNKHIHFVIRLRFCDYSMKEYAKAKIMSECWPSAPKMQTGQKADFLDAMVLHHCDATQPQSRCRRTNP